MLYRRYMSKHEINEMAQAALGAYTDTGHWPDAYAAARKYAEETLGAKPDSAQVFAAVTIARVQQQGRRVMHNEIPQNTQEAVELGLYLAITADTDEKSADALQLAKELALDLSPAEMEGAKANVRKFIADERLRSQMMKSAKKKKR